MNVEIFAICDAATDASTKLNLLGVFDTIFVSSFPAVHPQCAIAVRLRFHSGDGDTHSLDITLRNPEGEDLIPPISGRIEATGAVAEGAINAVFNLQGLSLPDHSDLSLQLNVDSIPAASLPVFVKLAPQSAAHTGVREGS